MNSRLSENLRQFLQCYEKTARNPKHKTNGGDHTCLESVSTRTVRRSLYGISDLFSMYIECMLVKLKGAWPNMRTNTNDFPRIHDPIHKSK